MNAITQWRTRVISWTGLRSSRWHSTRKKAERFYNQVPPTERRHLLDVGKMCAVRTTNMILEGKKSNSARKRAHADASGIQKERSGDRSFAVCLNWACAEWRIENGEWKMNAMAECCVGGQWPPLRLSVCKSLELCAAVIPRAPSLALRVIHLVPHLRRVNRMCSSTLSVNCEYFTK